MSLSNTKTIVIACVIVLVTFVAGMFTGIFVDHLTRRPHGGPRIRRAAAHMMLSRLDRHLDLTDDQEKKIGEILRRRHERITELWEGVRPQVSKEIEATNAEIERLLTPEQRAKFQEMKMRLGPPHDGPPGRREGRRRREPTR